MPVIFEAKAKTKPMVFKTKTGQVAFEVKAKAKAKVKPFRG